MHLIVGFHGTHSDPPAIFQIIRYSYWGLRTRELASAPVFSCSEWLELLFGLRTVVSLWRNFWVCVKANWGYNFLKHTICWSPGLSGEICFFCDVRSSTTNGNCLFWDRFPSTIASDDPHAFGNSTSKFVERVASLTGSTHSLVIISTIRQAHHTGDSSGRDPPTSETEQSHNEYPPRNSPYIPQNFPQSSLNGNCINLDKNLLYHRSVEKTSIFFSFWSYKTLPVAALFPSNLFGSSTFLRALQSIVICNTSGAISIYCSSEYSSFCFLAERWYHSLLQRNLLIQFLHFLINKYLNHILT